MRSLRAAVSLTPCRSDCGLQQRFATKAVGANKGPGFEISVVEKHGGSINVKRRVGEKTTFEGTLKVAGIQPVVDSAHSTRWPRTTRDAGPRPGLPASFSS